MFYQKTLSGFPPAMLQGFFAAPLPGSPASWVKTGQDCTEKLKVAVLYARSDSVYKRVPGCDVFDSSRNALSFEADLPVIAHPPCRLWGRLRQLAKAPQSERALAFHAVDMVRRNGGVLEHPSQSSLWQAAGLPAPGAGVDQHGGWTLPVLQSWWGHPAPKSTWLYIVGVTPRELPAFPFELGKPSGRIAKMSSSNPLRDSTPFDLALWLLSVARLAGQNRTASYL